VIGLLIIIEPKNPQEYNFIYDVNSFIAIELAYISMSLVFLAIGAPRKGTERITQLLARMRTLRRKVRFWKSPEEHFSWETRMYDELQQLQAVTKDPAHRKHGVNLLLSGLKARQTLASAPAGFNGN
jgi:hypothetical protein